jgi:hypothetical protein
MTTPCPGADGPSPDQIAQTLFELLDRRAPGATLCPSEVARALAPAPAWRGMMSQVREVAQALADRGQLLVTRGGVPVRAEDRGGPIRLGRPGDAPPTGLPGSPGRRRSRKG